MKAALSLVLILGWGTALAQTGWTGAEFHDGTPLGGKIKSRSKSVQLVCLERHEEAGCVNIGVEFFDRDTGKTEIINEIRLLDPELIVGLTREEIAEKINTEFRRNIISGIQIAVWSARFSEFPLLVGIPATLLGGSVDIIKAPIVGIIYLGNQIGSIWLKRRIQKHLEFLLNPKKQGRSRRTRPSYFDSLVKTLKWIGKEPEPTPLPPEYSGNR